MMKSAKIRQATAFAPATVANVAVGFDILGFALKGLGETASVIKIKNSKEVILMPVKGFPQLSTDPTKNTATAGLLRLIREKNLNFGFQVTLEKTIPVGSGLGGSATSAVAALVAANALLEKKLNPAELLDYALTGEEVASQSRHADNIAPSLLGGLVFVSRNSESEAQVPITVKIKTPNSLRCIILLPDSVINTKDSRASLQKNVSLKKMTEQMSNLAGFLLGCQNSDFNLMREFLKDVVIEPQRGPQIPFFTDLQKSARAAGALGCSISGSGPAIFALAENQKTAIKIELAMLVEAKRHKIPIKASWVSPISGKGAHLLNNKNKFR